MMSEHDQRAKRASASEPSGSPDDANERTARRPRRERPGPPSFEIVVIEGPDTGVVFPLEVSSCLLVGTSAVCGARLADGTAMPRHCSFEIGGQHVRLLDFSQATRVNGVLTAEAFLVGGETVRVGKTALTLRRKSRAGAGASPRVSPLPRFYGDSAVLSDLYARLPSLVRSARPLLLVGERGVGKTLLAAELHRESETRHEPFVSVARGASTEIVRALFDGTDSALVRAAGGTLFIEEVADLDEEGQARLLAMIERAERTCRVVAATSRQSSLSRELIAAFGRDRIVLPPLREREGDVELLARRFWVELGAGASLPDDFVARFEGHPWPGNVRELRIAVEDRIRHGGETSSGCEPPAQRVSQEKDDDSIEKVLKNDLPLVEARNELLAEFERRYIERALERSNRNVARAAAASGIAHRYFQRLKSRNRHT